jgi:class 3 adenylate cyclase
MKDQLRQALEDAQGTTEFLIVVVGDIRGFSTFSQRHESEEVALFIKRVYIKLIDDYFPFADYFKATGDGLLLGVHYNETDVREKAQLTVRACLNAVRDFPKFCKNDPMINFTPPDLIGFGVARGTTCALVSNGAVIDYSGALPNMASRLMELARPFGVVLDGAFGVDLLAPATKKLFRPEKVYIRSVAEHEPRPIHVLKNAVEISSEARHPLRRPAGTRDKS